MNRYDTHVHTLFSHDGRDPMADYASRVDAGIADGIGFSEHAEFRPGSSVRGALDTPGYLESVADWRRRGYDFYAGVEIGWSPAQADEIQTYLGHHRFGFVIGSVHNLPVAAISGRDPRGFANAEVFDQVITQYGEAVESSLAVEAFDVVGHPGVFLRHLSREFCQAPGRQEKIQDLEDDMAWRIARSSQLLEVNTSGMFSARGEPCAGRFLLERYRLHGGRTVTLGSDAHRAADLRRGFPDAAELLRGLGFTEVFLPWDKAHPVPLDEFASPPL